MIKLLATDLDGTLFYPKRKFRLMTSANRHFLKDFYHAGGKILLVTGRDTRIASKVQSQLKIDITILGCNGAFVYENGKTIINHPMDNKKLMDVYIQMRNKYGIICWMLFDDTPDVKIAATNIGKFLSALAIVGNFFNGNYAEKYIISEKAMLQAIAKGTCYKLMPIFGLGKKAIERARISTISVNDIFKDSFTFSQDKIAMEITAAGVNKGKALIEYIDAIGIKADEVAVVGDSNNDVPMFHAFPNSFVMASGIEEAKSEAAHVVRRVSDIRDYVMTADGKLK
jgi:Cof subfamily protein (haloacid dehalogenase superfamily)